MWYMEQLMNITQVQKHMDAKQRMQFNDNQLETARIPLAIAFGVYLFVNLVWIPFLIELSKKQEVSFMWFYLSIVLLGDAALCFIYGKGFAEKLNGRKLHLVYFTYIFLLVQNVFHSVVDVAGNEYFLGPNLPSVFLLMNTFFTYMKLRQDVRMCIMVGITSLTAHLLIFALWNGGDVLPSVGHVIIHLCIYALANAMGLLSCLLLQIHFKAKFMLINTIIADRKEQEKEKEQSEHFLENLFPHSVAEVLKNELDRVGTEKIIAENFEQVSIAFADICGFTKLSSEMSPEKIVTLLNEIFSSFDKILESYPRVEKIKTIGDAYMAVAGLQDDNDPAKSVEEIAEFALSMQREIAAISQRLNLPINVRVGVSTGDVVAGVIGVDKFSFDVWGAPINLASILESTSVPGKIQTSRATYELLRDKYEFEERGLVELKGGKQDTYFLIKRKPGIGPFERQESMYQLFPKLSQMSRSAHNSPDGPFHSSASRELYRIQQKLKDRITNFSLRFTDSSLESDYKRDEMRKYGLVLRVGGYVELFMFFLLATLIIMSSSLTSNLVVIFGVGLFVSLCIVMIYSFAQFGSKYFHIAASLQTLLSGGLLFVTLSQEMDSYYMVLVAISINILYIYVFTGIPLFFSLSLASVQSAAVIFAASMLQSPTQTVYLSFLLLFVNIMGAVMRYTSERESRESFLLILLAEEERKLLHAERTKSERLLRCILPQKIAERLNNKFEIDTGTIIADTFYEASVLFASIHNFTVHTSHMSAFDQVALLNKIFSKFDMLANNFGLQKIKTFGDAYLVVGGVLTPRHGHHIDIARMALAMQHVIKQFNLNLRIGIGIGTVVAGVLGTTKLTYDLWSDAVNASSRMESTCLPGKIQVTEHTYNQLKKKFHLTERGLMDIKGKGLMRTFWLEGEINSSLPNAAVQDLL